MMAAAGTTAAAASCAGVALCFLAVAVAYMGVASRAGFRLAHDATGMPAMWAALLAATGLLAEAIVLRQSKPQHQSEPRYPAVVRSFKALLVVTLVIAFVSFACLKDGHAAAWSALGALAMCVVMLHRCWRRRAAQPKSSPVVPLKTADAVAVAASAPAAAPAAAQTPTPTPPTCRRRFARCCCLWTPLVLATVAAVAFGVGAAMTAHEAVLYAAPGTHFVLAAAPGASDTVRVHLYCVGERADPSRPVVIFEHGGGASSFSFFGVQQHLAAQGIRSCAYDRPGFGWSQSFPVGAESLASYDHVISSLLQAAGEAPPYVMAGHSAGVELVQVYARNHPGDVVGVSLLDGYPDWLQLHGLTPAQVRFENARVCGVLQAARAFEGAGLLRPIFSRRGAFEPASEAGRQARCASMRVCMVICAPSRHDV